MKTTVPFAALATVAAIPAVAQAQPLSGPRLEVSAGYDRFLGRDHLEGDADIVPDRLSGVRLGIAAGYDIAVSSRVTIGGTIGIGNNVSGRIDARLARDTLTITGGRDIELAARVGVAVTSGTLVYGTGGYAHSRLRAILREWEGSGYAITANSAGAGGVRLGAGVEQALAGPFNVHVQYRWTSYGRDIGYQTRPVRHQLLAGVGVRF